MRLGKRVAAAALALAGFLASAQAAEVKLIMPLGRVAYQTNEMIEVAIVRSGKEPLPGGELTASLLGEDGGKLVCTFPLKAVPADGGDARATEHLRLNGWLLRPGKYTLEVACDGAADKASLEVYSHLRRSSFKLVDWGCRAKDEEQALLGENSMGLNLLYASYGGISPDNMIRGGADYMRCCTMSGAHQMDLRQECDWSDPYVLVGAEARVVREALEARTRPNAVGVHFYDEPGLTWHKHPKTGIMAPYNLPSQDRAYKSAFGRDPLQYCDVKPDDPAAVQQWMEMNRWKMSFIEAAWKYSAFGVSWVRPDLLSVTQSVYGFNAYADGYYFNAARCLPVISGHGGYSDWGPGFLHPGWTFEMGRMRDLQKPNWYLPTWFQMSSNQFRLEQYLSFMMNLQGMAIPPDDQIHKPFQTKMAEGLVESNKLMARLGTIFNAMPVDRGEVAVLYSLSQILDAQVKDMQASNLNKSAYEGGGHSREKAAQACIAGKMIHINLFPIVEEDVLDGTLAANHKAVFLPGINYLEPRVLAALEAYIAGGGTVIVSDDARVKIKGAVALGYAMSTERAEKLAQLQKENKAEFQKLDTTQYYYDTAAPVAKALKARLDAIGIKPPLEADSPYIITSRQACGDVEYLFAVNGTWDEKEAKRNSTKSATATLSMMADERPVYDAVFGRQASEFKVEGDQLKGRFRFGPGQMRVFARTNKTIGGVDVRIPTIFRAYTLPQNPLQVRICATVVDTHNAGLNGAIPMQVRVVDPLGVVRYELFRATEDGVLKLALPLAANDAAGEWKVTVRELLSGLQGTIPFTCKPAPQCGAVAGLVPRALCFGNDRENIFRFFRLYQDVTIVKGSSEADAAAATRLVEVLKPLNVRCTIVNAADVNKPRQIDPEAARTWCGLGFGRIPADGKITPELVGFAVQGPSILIGTPEDNPLIKFAAEKKFLPYRPDKATLPGRGRGMLAWQRDAVSYGQDSITVIAYDAAGLAEAVGTLYEAAAAIDPLMPLLPPATAMVTPAAKNTQRGPEARLAWRTALPDRPVQMKAENDSTLVIITNDGSTITVGKDGKISGQAEGADTAVLAAQPVAPKLPPLLVGKTMPYRLPKHIASNGQLTAVGYWGGTVEVFDASGNVRSSQLLPDDVSGLVWLGNRLVVGQSSGSLVALAVR